MKKGKTLQRMFGVTLLAMMFGAGTAYAQLGQENAAGKTPANEAGKMSITGENATSSTSPPETSGASTSPGAGAAGAGSSTESQSSGASAGSSTEGQSSGAGAGSSELSKSDQNMMKQLSYANMAEIEAAQMALDKSQDEQVKTFAQKMIDDHTKAHDQLRELAQAKNVTLPTELDKKHKSEIQKLSKLSGDKFDKQYLSQGGVADHRKAHQLLQRIEKRAKDDELKSLAASLTPVINEHWETAKQMKAADAGTKPPATGASGTRGAGESGTSGSSTTESK